jgi:RNA polymerase sigma-70 factor (ECF subfamily)
MVAGIVLNMVKDRDVANDVGQEVFIRLLRYLKNFKGDAKLSTYIGRSAINLSLNEVKREQKKQMRRVDNDMAFERLHIASSSDELEAKELLKMALQKLKPEHRSVITLRYIEGFSTKETSDILDIRQGTVLSRLSRGLEIMKTNLKKLGYETTKRN